MSIQHLSFQAEAFLKAFPVDPVSLFSFSSSPSDMQPHMKFSQPQFHCWTWDTQALAWSLHYSEWWNPPFWPSFPFHKNQDMEDDWCVIGLHPDMGLGWGQGMHSGPGSHGSGISISSPVALSALQNLTQTPLWENDNFLFLVHYQSFHWKWIKGIK